jgi:4-hydroxy-4-methyl-2-oxoglutarate aldolase
VGGVSVAAGDWLVGDADGVAVVSAPAIEDVLRAGRARVDKEEAIFGALREGKTTLELLGLDASPVEGA